MSSGPGRGNDSGAPVTTLRWSTALWRPGPLLPVRLEVFGLHDPSHVDPFGADQQGELPRVLDGLGERVHLEDREAGDQLLGLGERAVDHPHGAVVDLDPGAGRTRRDTL